MSIFVDQYIFKEISNISIITLTIIMISKTVTFYLKMFFLRISNDSVFFGRRNFRGVTEKEREREMERLRIMGIPVRLGAATVVRR